MKKRLINLSCQHQNISGNITEIFTTNDFSQQERMRDSSSATKMHKGRFVMQASEYQWQHHRDH
ncbi:hypothetical protein PJI17_32530, partial [Mycobacterium kansasii]